MADWTTLSVRNVGAGIAVLQGWHPHERVRGASEPPPAADAFRPLLRDQYIAAGDLGEGDSWRGTAARHWYLDTAAPR